ncbi:hypothetical protein D9V34_08755 [Mycetocola lacteus]|uniref:Uncharacterized protein n=1 Tax=Mycetocola lacteus TaxID=76637 RepID=A0A3L7AS17_9MICO|nr:hypothetical protein [Mycetocola lacteus]RLP83303.1 hypothetical protein D9V34_08755 [Mycetocola lacteus]
MDGLSQLAFIAVIIAAGFYVLYCVIRAAVLSALRAHADEVEENAAIAARIQALQESAEPHTAPQNP